MLVCLLKQIKLSVEFDDNVTEEHIEEYGNDLARDNADMYGIIKDAEGEVEENGFEVEYSDVYWATYERLDIPREEIEECYGSITNEGYQTVVNYLVKCNQII